MGLGDFLVLDAWEEEQESLSSPQEMDWEGSLCSSELLSSHSGTCRWRDKKQQLDSHKMRLKNKGKHRRCDWLKRRAGPDKRQRMDTGEDVPQTKRSRPASQQGAAEGTDALKYPCNLHISFSI